MMAKKKASSVRKTRTTKASTTKTSTTKANATKTRTNKAATTSTRRSTGRGSTATGSTGITRRRGNSSATTPTERGVWGVQSHSEVSFSEFFRSGLLIPKFNFNDPDETISPAADLRSQASAGRRMHVYRPQKNVREVLEKLRLVDVKQPQSFATNAATRVGMFAAPESLGIASAFFRNEKEHSDVMNEIQDEFDFVPDFPLSLPCRVSMEDSPSNRRTAMAQISMEWPDESGVKAAHAAGVRGAGVLMAVLDTGVDADHVELNSKRITHRHVSLFPNNPNWPSRDVRGFDTDGHGTHVCGIIAGRHLGVAPEVKLHAAGVIESETTLTSITRVVAGLRWVMNQFSRPENERLPGVLNLSLGFPPTIDGTQGATFQQRLRTMQLILRSMVQANILPVAAIGNDGAGNYGFPGAFPEALGVGAVSFTKKIASFSGSGPVAGSASLKKPDVVGYGVGVNSSVERDYDNESIYQRFNGTSMAAPYAAAIAALYRSRRPTMSVDDTLKALRDNAISVSGPANRVGAGLVRFR